MGYHDLLKECEQVFTKIEVTSAQVDKLEEETRGQSSNKAWFIHRAGRITASNCKAVSHTNPCMPSQSLIKKICYPEAFKFSTAATRWGCTHEKDAIQSYTAAATEQHGNLQIMSCGLFVDPERAFLGASPDGIVSCICCGKGAVEVKCPLCIQDGLPDESPKTFCMSKEDGEWTLKKEHAYYYQVQMQLALCKLPYCDFVIWTSKGISVERISADEQFFSSQLEDLQHFFIYGILPEIVGKWYTRKPITNLEGIVPQPLVIAAGPSSTDTEEGEDFTKLWCYCNKPSFGDMVMCNYEKCTIQWFHFDCLCIRCPPKGKWYCPSCCKLPKFSKRKKQ